MMRWNINCWIGTVSCILQGWNTVATEINDVLQRYAKENEGVYFINPYEPEFD